MKEARDNMDGEETLQVNQSTITVAEILRTCREKRGQDLRSVANVLRIRYVFLEAIERGDFGSLPGDTYAYGFVRTYAEHLELNKDEIVRQFKKEVENYGNTKQLVFPTPVPESKTPGLTIILISIVLLAVAYGGWTAVSRFDAKIPDWVPFLSEESSEGSAETPAETSSQTVDEPADTSAISVTPNSVISAPENETEITIEEAVEAAVEGSLSPPATNTITTIDTLKETVGIESKPEIVIVEETEAVITPGIPSSTIVEGAVSETAASEGDANGNKVKTTGTQQNTVAAVVTPPPPPEPKVFGDEGGTSSISIVAESDTWMHIVDASGETIFSRVLRAGSVYNVPQREGLTMTTGNAGGITLKLNGQALPKLGSLGDVRRDILLSEEGLLKSILSE